MRDLVETELCPGIVADVDDDGSSDWVIFFHSRYVNKSLWTETARSLERGSVCAFNRRGFGAGDTRRASPERFLEDIADVMERLRPTRCVLVGSSIGAGLALAACATGRFPIVGAVLAGFLVPSAENADVASRFDTGSVTERTFTTRYASEHPKVVEAFEALSASVPREAREFSVVDFWKVLSAFPYHTIRVPLLFVTGTDDNLMPPHLVRESVRRLSTARYVALPNVGHGVITQAQRRFADELATFLGSVGFTERTR